MRPDSHRVARRLAIAAWGAVSAFLTADSVAVTFTFTAGPTLASKIASGTPSEMAEASALMSAAGTAGAKWSAILKDPITVKLAIEIESMGPSTLGYFDVDPVTSSFAYGAVKTALAADVSSPADSVAVFHLQPGPSLNVITNTTSTTPSSRMQFIPGTDDFIFNSVLRLTRANQKALALLPGADGGPGADGTLKINTTKLSTLDFDPTDGITAGKTDAVAVLAHEMAHGLGFISGVDHVDYAGEKGFVRGRPSGYPADIVIVDDTIMTPLDLFRYSGDSLAATVQPPTGKVLDWAFDAATGLPVDNPYFSIDGGASVLGKFATGVYNGDGAQAQHWKDESSPLVGGFPLGLMDPDIAFGELGVISPLDMLAMDAIGYTIPEPGGVLLLLSAGGLLLCRRRLQGPAIGRVAGRVDGAAAGRRV